MRAPLGLLLVLLAPAPALAQWIDPIPPFLFDIRGLYIGLGEDETTAADLGIPIDDLPKRGLGGTAGLHVYPLRTRSFALGFSGEGIVARGRAQSTDPIEGTLGPVVERRFRGLMFGVSLNFGHRDGWSYLTVGMGPLRYETFTGPSAPEESMPAQMSFAFGGGARWFTTKHVAFCIDLRFYETKPVPTTDLPGRERQRLMVFSAGVGFK